MLPAQGPPTSPKQMEKKPGKITWPWGKMDYCSNEWIETRVLMHSGFTNPFIVIFIIIIKIKKLVKVVFLLDRTYIDNTYMFWIIQSRFILFLIVCNIYYIIY
jgi:hypothetical protein